MEIKPRNIDRLFLGTVLVLAALAISALLIASFFKYGWAALGYLPIVALGFLGLWPVRKLVASIFTGKSYKL